jgi:hypothetical protein
MKRFGNFWNNLSFSLLALMPFAANALPTIDDAKAKLDHAVEAVKTSPIYNILMYSATAIGFFIALVIVVFFLIMLLHRD